MQYIICSKETMADKVKPPYQGNKRTYGEFKCPQCGKKWESGNSWANCGQKCKSCENKKYVYPYKQTELKKSENKSDPKKPHPESECQKCRSLGRACTR